MTVSDYQPEHYKGLTPRALAALVEAAWLKITDTRMKNAGPEEARGQAVMLLAVEWSCDLMRDNMKHGHLIIGVALDLMEPDARRYYVAEVIYQLARLGWRAEHEPDDGSRQADWSMAASPLTSDRKPLRFPSP